MDRADITENELARQTGVPQPTINRILSGESRDPRTGTLEKLAEFFNVTVTQLRGEAPLIEGADKQAPDPLEGVLSPKQRNLLRLFNALTEAQQNEILQSMEATRKRNEEVYESLSRKKKSGAA